MLKVDHITIGYGDRLLVRDISFELAPGECVLLAGANGTGKTTLLSWLASGPEAAIVLIPTNIPKVKGFTVESFIHTGCYRESDWRGRISEEVARKMEEALDVLGIQELKQVQLLPDILGRGRESRLDFAHEGELEGGTVGDRMGFHDVGRSKGWKCFFQDGFRGPELVEGIGR